ncbi:ROK family protein [Oryzicola mucosus]|uniref:ROK family transcriptional regulator n=1 Tax=Oryzicola mucosus TaxID=2767425 RepID=A0A8J6PFR1_9HYPH|nr:ROK family protein [Oryzicola mucosus]MBD0414289.1 ROK family transcriptional regulator [Oryzicola mucosus]
MSVGIRHDDLRRRNRAMVLGAVRRAGQPSRTEIASVTGLSNSTISAISADLIAEGILAETKSEIASLKRGRPQVAIALNAKAATVVSVVLSLDHLSAATIGYSGEVIVQEDRRLHTLSMSEEELLAECVDIIRKVVARSPHAGPVLRTGLAVQGVTDSAARRLLWSPITPHQNIAFADRIEEVFAVPVSVENDCNMIAEALRWRDPERYRNDFIAILLSHGIGMGVMLKGKVFTGTHSSGGEFGHMIHRPGGALCRCGRHGCVEAYAGNYAIWRNAHGHDENERPVDGIGDEDIRAIAERARTTEGPERAAFRTAGEAIGYGLGNLFALIDAAPIALVGVGASAFDLMERSVRQAIAKTVGGLHSEAISFDTEGNEMQLTRQGSTMQALAFIDNEVFAPQTRDSEVVQSSRIA